MRFTSSPSFTLTPGRRVCVRASVCALDCCTWTGRGTAEAFSSPGTHAAVPPRSTRTGEGTVAANQTAKCAYSTDECTSRGHNPQERAHCSDEDDTWRGNQFTSHLPLEIAYMGGSAGSVWAVGGYDSNRAWSVRVLWNVFMKILCSVGGTEMREKYHNGRIGPTF